VAIDNQTTIARSDRFTGTVSCQPFAVRASDRTLWGRVAGSQSRLMAMSHWQQSKLSFDT